MLYAVKNGKLGPQESLTIVKRCLNLIELSRGDSCWISINSEDNSIVVSSEAPEHQKCRACGDIKELKPSFPLTPAGKYSTICESCSLLNKAMIKAVHRQAHPMRERARHILTIALQTGRITPGPCIIPGCCETKTEGHHPIYQKPQLIVWLCNKHHKMIDNNQLELPNDYRIITIPLPKKIKTKARELTCKVLYCGETAISVGYCPKHYRTEKRRLAKEFRAQNQT